MAPDHDATERRTLQDALARFPADRTHHLQVLARLRAVTHIRDDASLLDVGAAQGSAIITWLHEGLKGFGVEPSEKSRAVAERLAENQGVTIELRPGVAEDLPWEACQFDVVHAEYVLEHVLDAQKTFEEAYRVLKPGGVFWFATASSVSPRQDEIGGFPCFGWYPDRLKRRIMAWARDKKQHLVGGTQYPAMNWFSPWKARRMLRQAGFRRIYDRWDLRLPSEGGRLYQMVLCFIRLCAVTKFAADVLVPCCAYAAIK